MSPAKDQPWGQMAREGKKAWEYFQLYRDTEPPRRLKDFAGVVGLTHRYVRELSYRYSWTSRVLAWDKERQRAHDTVVLSEVERVSRDQLKAWSTARVLGSVALVRALQHAQTHKDLPVDVRDALALLKEATAAERLILGEATSREAVISLDRIEEMPLERAELLLELIQEAGGQ